MGVSLSMATFETRRESYEKLNKEIRYAQIIKILTEIKKPLTAKEIAVEMYNRGFTPTAERNYSAPRLTELTIKGIVKPTGEKKVCEYTGKSVALYGLRNSQKEEKQINIFEKIDY